MTAASDLGSDLQTLTPSPKQRRRAWWLLPLFLLHALPFASRPALVGGDEVHYALLAHSLATDGDLDLGDDYAAVEKGSKAAGRKRAGQVLETHTRFVRGRELPTHPIGIALLAAPLVWVQQRLVPGSAPDLPLVGLTLAVTFVALVAGWRALASHLGDRRLAAAWAFGAYFSTPLWFYSRTFFTEPFTWAFAVLALAALQGRRMALGSLLLGLTLLTKETALLLVAPIAAGTIWLAGVRRAWPVLIGPVLAAGAYAIKNFLIGVPWTTAAQPFAVGDPLAGALGLVADPRHGLLAFAPALIVATVWAVAQRASSRNLRWGSVGEAAALAAFTAYYLLHAAWVDWRGGACYGPRLLVPALPALIVVAARFRPTPTALRFALAPTFVFGFTTAWSAALSPWTAFWGATPFELFREQPVIAVSGALLATALVVASRRLWPAPTS